MSPLKGGAAPQVSLKDGDADAFKRLHNVSLWYKKDTKIAEQLTALVVEIASSSVAQLHAVLEVLAKALAAGVEEGGGKLVSLGNDDFDDRAMLKEKCQNVLKLYKDDEQLQPEDAAFMLQLLAHHPRGEEKAERCQAIAAGQHPSFPTRCFYVVRPDGREDFSYIRCVDNIPTFEVQCQERICNAICRVLQVHPAAMPSFAGRVEERFPPMRGPLCTVEKHRNWVQAILYLCTRMPPVTEFLLMLIVRRMVQIDTDVNKLEAALPDEVFGDGGDQAAKPVKEEIDQKAQILDCHMMLCLEFLQRHLTLTKCKDIDKDKMVVTVMKIFDSAVLHTHKVRCVQFLWFYLSSLKPNYSEAFLSVLLQVAWNGREMVERKTLALSYIASFVARASFLPNQYALQTAQYLAKLARDQYQIAETGPSSESQVNFLLSIIQAFCYILCWWVETFAVEEVEKNKTGLTVLLPDPTEGHKEGADAFTPVMLSAHWPLTQIRRSVAHEFCRRIRRFRPKLCDQIRDQLRQVPPSRGRVAAIDADELSQSGAAFFPFDPYRLRHSSIFLFAIHRSWTSPDDSGDEDSLADDEEGFGHDPEGKCRTMSAASDKDEETSDVDFTDEADVASRGFIPSAAPSPAFRPNAMDMDMSPMLSPMMGISMPPALDDQFFLPQASMDTNHSHLDSLLRSDADRSQN